MVLALPHLLWSQQTRLKGVKCQGQGDFAKVGDTLPSCSHTARYLIGAEVSGRRGRRANALERRSSQPRAMRPAVQTSGPDETRVQVSRDGGRFLLSYQLISFIFCMVRLKI